MQNTLGKEFAVIDWEDEDSVSVVPSRHVAFVEFSILEMYAEYGH